MDRSGVQGAAFVLGISLFVALASYWMGVVELMPTLVAIVIAASFLFAGWHQFKSYSLKRRAGLVLGCVSFCVLVYWASPEIKEGKFSKAVLAGLKQLHIEGSDLKATLVDVLIDEDEDALSAWKNEEQKWREQIKLLLEEHGHEELAYSLLHISSSPPLREAMKLSSDHRTKSRFIYAGSDLDEYTLLFRLTERLDRIERLLRSN